MLSRKQHRAIAALLTCPTQAKAAKQAGIAERTLRSWQAQPEFAARYRDSQRRVLDCALAKLQELASEAVETLRKLLGNKNAGLRCRAALGILKLATGNVALADVMNRLEKVERELKKNPGKTGADRSV